MCGPSEKRAGQPTEEQLRKADRNGVMPWKEFQDIEHIKAAPNGCVRGLCHAVRSPINIQTTDKAPTRIPVNHSPLGFANSVDKRHGINMLGAWMIRRTRL